MRTLSLAIALPVALAAGAAGCAASRTSGDAGARDAAVDRSGDAGAIAVWSVGPGGGSLTVAGVTLEIPPLALGSTQTITVTADGEAPPDGYQAYSPLYHFEPHGLIFARPVAVSFPLAGGEIDPVVFWSHGNTTAYDQVPSTIEDRRIVGYVTHFSTGFVARRQGPAPVDAAVSDSEGGVDAALDASPSDRPDAASDAASDTSEIDGGTEADAASDAVETGTDATGPDGAAGADAASDVTAGAGTCQCNNGCHASPGQCLLSNGCGTGYAPFCATRTSGCPSSPTLVSCTGECTCVRVGG